MTVPLVRAINHVMRDFAHSSVYKVQPPTPQQENSLPGPDT